MLGEHPRWGLPSAIRVATGPCPVMGRLRRRRPHLGKRGRLGGAAPQLLGPEEGKWLSFPSFLTPTPHRVGGGGVGWVGFPRGRAGSKHTTPRPIGLRGEHPPVPRPISVPRDSTEMWCGPGIMLEVGILVSVFKSSTNLATLAL